MPTLHIREQNQVTLPHELVELLWVESSGQVAYQIVAEGMLIRPVGSTLREDKLSKIRRLSQPGREVYRDVVEVDSFIDGLRSE